MTWEKHIPAPKAGKTRKVTTGVRIGVNHGKNGKVPRVVISLSREIVYEVFGVSKGDSFFGLVYIGRDENAGKVRIVDCNKDIVGALPIIFMKVNGGGWYRVLLGEVAGFPNYPHEMTEVVVEKRSGSLVFTLPIWKPDITKVTKEAQPEKPAAQFKAAPPAPKPIVQDPEARARCPTGVLLTSARKDDPLVAKARAAVPAPDFSGSHKPTRKGMLDTIGKMKAG